MDTFESPFSLWSSMWLNPRKTIRQVVDINPRLHLLLLSSLGGIGQTLTNAASRAMGEQIPVPQLILLCVILGPLSGLITITIGGWLITWLGNLFGGTASRAETKAALAWSWVPFAATLPLWIARYILFGRELFLKDMPMVQGEPVLNALWTLSELIDSVLAIWSLLLLFHAVAEINRFSTLRGVGAVLAAGLLTTIPLLILLSMVSPL